MSVNSKYRSSVSLLKFAFKKYPLEAKINTCLVRTFHSNSLVDRTNANSPSYKLKPSSAVIIKDLIQAASFHLSSRDNISEKPTSYDRNYIAEERAINEYLLEPNDLNGLRMTVRHILLLVMISCPSILV